MRMGAAPDVLCLGLKRFCVSRTGKMCKNDAHVSFPLEGLAFGAEGQKRLYTLKAVIVHEGASRLKGHYTCYAVVGGERGGRWIHANDRAITQATTQQVRDSQAYMLLYEAEAT